MNEMSNITFCLILLGMLLMVFLEPIVYRFYLYKRNMKQKKDTNGKSVGNSQKKD